MSTRLVFVAACCTLLLRTLAASAQMADPVDALHREIPKSTVLTYTQRYTDTENEDVLYRGILFLRISKVALEGCDLSLSVDVQDRYTGQSFQHRRSSKPKDLGQTVVTNRYTYLLPLSDLEVSGVLVRTGTPIQLEPGTGYSCEEASGCNVVWLVISSKGANLAESRETNDTLDLEQRVPEITVPMSSQSAAQDSAAAVRLLVARCSASRKTD